MATPPILATRGGPAVRLDGDANVDSVAGVLPTCRMLRLRVGLLGRRLEQASMHASEVRRILIEIDEAPQA